jgi:hypothetical protein
LNKCTVGLTVLAAAKIVPKNADHVNYYISAGCRGIIVKIVHNEAGRLIHVRIEWGLGRVSNKVIFLLSKKSKFRQHLLT